jgi:hypothetical protein
MCTILPHASESVYRFFILTLLPGRFALCPFIFFTEKPLPSLRVPLLAAETKLLVLLCTLGITLAIAIASSVVPGGLGVVVEGDVEEVFFVRVTNLCALTFCLMG